MADWLTASPTTQGSSNYGNPYLFTGRRLDTMDAGSLTIYHYRARTYDPQTGRFMQWDPLGINPAGGIYRWDEYLSVCEKYACECIRSFWFGFGISGISRACPRFSRRNN
ncbi:MAG: hypothetical protein J7M01_03710 [Candidatus Marinimicrobia bacterium]|nr:hypothetical protein [Candidatus Neomarinimicrobiota bacterium]